MTKEILEHSLGVYKRIEAIKNVLNGVIGDDGQISRFKRIEVRVEDSAYSLFLNKYDSDAVISMLCKEMDRLKEEFENIKA